MTEQSAVRSIPRRPTAAIAALAAYMFTFASVTYTAEFKINSVGMRLAHVSSGEFQRGNGGEIDYARVSTAYRPKGSGTPAMASNPLEWDEAPPHTVRISRPFWMAVTPVTNAQYEAFRPDHRARRGGDGFSKRDDEAVLFVSWHDAVAYCEWLSKREGRTYRLPTEAEWEYACRAGTTTAYHTGAELPSEYHHHQVMNREHSLEPGRVSLVVGKTPANAWGLHDMHGLVEEWCLDWYGPYEAGLQTDPVGRIRGIARITRGGSHSTGLPFLRSANRSAAIPESHTYVIGFRVVAAHFPATKPLPEPHPARWARDVSQRPLLIKPASRQPVFREPRTYTRIPADANGPLYIAHSHCPSVTVCPNGDLLVVWFTTALERGREMLIAGARLRHGREEWDDADVFFHVPDRNTTGSALWWDGAGALLHANGVGVGDTYSHLALALRRSVDNGATWSEPRLIVPEHRRRNQVIDTFSRMSDGTLVLACDISNQADGGSAVHLSRDGGATWTQPSWEKPAPQFTAGETGPWIAGIHAGLVELRDGRWLAFGRGNDIDGRMPISMSSDGGQTWTYSASDFDPISSAQRLELMRLREGPILFVSFAKALERTDAAGRTRIGAGLFAAVSYDEGKTWPVRKLITSGGPRRILDAPCNRRWGEQYSVLDADTAEKRGYLTATQGLDGMIHLLSSGTHYAFNLAWLEAPLAAQQAP